MNTKARLFTYCDNHINTRIKDLSAGIKDLENDLTQETKSSAGDKYETSREMLNAEINKLSGQVQQFHIMKQTLAHAKCKNTSRKIQLGSLAETSTGSYFISVPIGKIQLETETVFAIGINSPIAKALLGKTKGEQVIFRSQTLEILEVQN